MKKAIVFLTLVLALVMILSACQSKEEQQETALEETPVLTVEAYPGPDSGNLTNPTPSGVSAYPDLKDGDELTWDQFWGILQNGEVKQVLLVDAPNIKVLLIDGRALMVVEPREGLVTETVTLCGDACKSVEVK